MFDDVQGYNGIKSSSRQQTTNLSDITLLKLVMGLRLQGFPEGRCIAIQPGQFCQPQISKWRSITTPDIQDGLATGKSLP